MKTGSDVRDYLTRLGGSANPSEVVQGEKVVVPRDLSSKLKFELAWALKEADAEAERLASLLSVYRQALVRGDMVGMTVLDLRVAVDNLYSLTQRYNLLLYLLK